MTGVMNRTRSNTLLQVLVLSAGLTGLVDASFWRYRLGIQSGSEDTNTCSVPDPMLTIVAGSAQVLLHESTGSASCIVPNNGAGIGLICTGAGSITIDVMETSSDAADGVGELAALIALVTAAWPAGVWVNEVNSLITTSPAGEALYSAHEP